MRREFQKPTIHTKHAVQAPRVRVRELGQNFFFRHKQGARVIAIDIDESRRGTAKAFGADFFLNALDGGMPDAIRELTGGRGATMALETAGAAAAGQDPLTRVRPWGTVCLVGIGTEISLSLANMLRTQLRIFTSWTTSIQAQKACADFVAERGIDLDSLFTDRWMLEQATEAYQEFNRQNSGKGVFLM